MDENGKITGQIPTDTYCTLYLQDEYPSNVCCGFGGTFSVKFKGISSAMAQQKVEWAIKTGAEYIVGTESSCVLNIQSYIKKHNLPIKTIHIADILKKMEVPVTYLKCASNPCINKNTIL